jgi:phosphoglycolate phosphatase-like HAD superfamily hydrolase
LIIAKGIFQLAGEMMERRADDERNPLILFLGKGCADAAKVPDTIQIARSVFQDSALPTKKYVAGRDRRYNEEVLEAFYEYLSDLSSRERHWLLQRFYAKVPVPLFYQDLVRLIERRFFLHILTTNIDTLLEQALNGAGMWPDRDYELISLSSSDRKPLPPDPASPGPRIMIVKLHGDLAKQETSLTPDEITEALQRHSRFLRGELSGDMVMVGYEFESEPVTRWLAETYSKLWREPPILWWVNEKRPSWQQVGRLEESRHIEYLDGENGRPEVFFGRLLYVLEDSAQKEVADTIEQFSYGVSTEPTASPGEEFSDARYLREQIRRSQQVLYSLEQNAIPGERDEQLEAQIEYQRSTIADMEDKLRDLGESRERLLALMHQVRDSAGRARVDPMTMDFLDSQIMTVMEQYDRYRPNQDVVSASVSATLVLTDRLGPRVVDPKVVRELASFVPSSTVRRAL